MDDALLVRVPQRGRDLAHQPNGLRYQLAHARQAVTQRHPIDERHRIIGQAVDIPSAQQRDDVRMLEPSGERDLALKTRHGQVGRELRRQHLRDNGTPQLRGGCHEDARHTSASKLALERVRRAERSLQLRAEF
jgi:hypothetical protein